MATTHYYNTNNFNSKLFIFTKVFIRMIVVSKNTVDTVHSEYSYIHIPQNY